MTKSSYWVMDKRFSNNQVQECIFMIHSKTSTNLNDGISLKNVHLSRIQEPNYDEIANQKDQQIRFVIRKETLKNEKIWTGSLVLTFVGLLRSEQCTMFWRTWDELMMMLMMGVNMTEKQVTMRIEGRFYDVVLSSALLSFPISFSPLLLPTMNFNRNLVQSLSNKNPFHLRMAMTMTMTAVTIMTMHYAKAVMGRWK